MIAAAVSGGLAPGEKMLPFEPRLYPGEDRERARLLDRLLYLPGAPILVYGFWLTLTA